MATGKRVKVDRGQARVHLQKAGEFLAAARASLGAGRADAATLEAIHAAISATDAVTLALAGVRSNDPDHARDALAIPLATPSTARAFPLAMVGADSPYPEPAGCRRLRTPGRQQGTRPSGTRR